MARATSLIAAAKRAQQPVADTVILDCAQRSTARVAVTSVSGAAIDIDLHQVARLRTDDLLALDDGRYVEVVAAAEPLLEARAVDVAALSRLAWHLGDRHVPVQVLPNRIRARREPAIEALLAALGARVVAIDAPFDPEGGAYEAVAGHGHHHGRHHGHAPHGHDHGHDHEH